jgi:hypothetical protein
MNRQLKTYTQGVLTIEDLDEARDMCDTLADALRTAVSYLEVVADDPFHVDSHGAKEDLATARKALAAYERFKA